MSNPQRCKHFNTKVNVGDAIGVTHQRKSLLEGVAQEQAVGTAVVTFASLTDAQQETVQKDAEERCILHVALFASEWGTTWKTEGGSAK